MISCGGGFSFEGEGGCCGVFGEVDVGGIRTGLGYVGLDERDLFLSMCEGFEGFSSALWIDLDGLLSILLLSGCIPNPRNCFCLQTTL